MFKAYSIQRDDGCDPARYQHPRAAMSLRAGADKDKYVEFYDKCSGDI